MLQTKRNIAMCGINVSCKCLIWLDQVIEQSALNVVQSVCNTYLSLCKHFSKMLITAVFLCCTCTYKFPL